MFLENFFERCGILFFFKMRPLFFFALLALPLSIVALLLAQETSELQELQKRFQAALRKERFAMERKNRKERFLERYSHANPYFLDETVEAFPLLQKEKAQLESLFHHPAVPKSEAIQERLFFLNENRLMFKEEQIESSKIMQEVQEKQRFSVQMDEEDLKQILTHLEDVSIEKNQPNSNAPQILIKDFRLKKLETPFHSEVFEVEMDLIKREFFK